MDDHLLSEVQEHISFNPVRTEEEQPPENNPLGIFCLDCGAYCIFDGKRWNCPNGHA